MAFGLLADEGEAMACSLGPGLVLLRWPVPGQENIPTNTAFFIEQHPQAGRELRIIVQTASGSSTVALTSIGSWAASPVPAVPIPSFDANILEAFTTSAPLEPLTAYEVRTSALQDGVEFWARTYRFTTGAGPDTEPPRRLEDTRLFYHRALDGPVLFDFCSNAEVDEITEAFLTFSASPLGALLTAEATYPASAPYRDGAKAVFVVPWNDAGQVRHAFFGRSSGPVCIHFRVIDGVGRTADSTTCAIEACAAGLDPYRWNTDQWEVGGQADCTPFIPVPHPDAGPAIDSQVIDLGSRPDAATLVDSGGDTALDGGLADAGALRSDDGCACSAPGPPSTSRPPWVYGICSLLLSALLGRAPVRPKARPPRELGVAEPKPHGSR